MDRRLNQNPKGLNIYRNERGNYGMNPKGSNIYRTFYKTNNPTPTGSNVCRKNKQLRQTTPMGSYLTNNDFYKHWIPSGLSQEIKTSETHVQMLMQAVLKEAFQGKK